MSKIKELMELSRYLGQRSDLAYESVMQSRRFLPRDADTGSPEINRYSAHWIQTPKSSSAEEEE